MEDLLKKVSYLKGLSEGLGIDDASTEGKLLIKIIDVLDEFTEVLEDTVEDQMILEEYVSLIDEDLFDMEDEFYDEYYDDYDDFVDFEDYELENQLEFDDENFNIEDEEE